MVSVYQKVKYQVVKLGMDLESIILNKDGVVIKILYYYTKTRTDYCRKFRIFKITTHLDRHTLFNMPNECEWIVPGTIED